MKTLSKRAEAYLGRLKRDCSWSCDRERITRYLEQQGLPLCKPAIRYQCDYSGFELTTRGSRLDAFRMQLFERDTIAEGEPPADWAIREEAGRHFFACGEQEHAQYDFYLSEAGEIVAESGGRIQMLYTSAEQLVECYALVDSLPESWQRFAGYYDIRDLEALTGWLLEHGFRQDRDCCDACNRCFSDGSRFVRCARWIGDDGFSCSLYGSDPKAGRQLLETLQKARLIE